MERRGSGVGTCDRRGRRACEFPRSFDSLPDGRRKNFVVGLGFAKTASGRPITAVQLTAVDGGVQQAAAKTTTIDEKKKKKRMDGRWQRCMLNANTTTAKQTSNADSAACITHSREKK